MDSTYSNSNETVIIFNQFDGIINDFIDILKGYSIQAYPRNLKLNTPSSENKILKLIEDLQLNYKNNIKNKIKTSKLVIFIATNDSVKSEKCIKLLELSRDLNIPILSLIVEEIKNLDDIKSTALSGIDHQHFEVYKDRVHANGYDQYLWLGVSFQDCINCIKDILMIENDKNTNTDNTKYYHISYLLSDISSVICVEKVLLIFKKIRKNLNDSNDYNSFYKIFLPDIYKSYAKPAFKGHEDAVFNYYQYILRQTSLDNKKANEKFIDIIKILDDIILNGEIFKSDELLDDNVEDQNFDFSVVHFNFLYKHIEEMLERPCLPSKRERVISYLKEEIEKNGINFDYANRILECFYATEINSIYSIYKNKEIIVFLLTKDYYESLKFIKLYNVAKQLGKIIYLVRLESSFDVNIKYDHNVVVHDISKHERHFYDGYLTRNFLYDLSSICNLSFEKLEYSIRNHIYICSFNSSYLEKTKELKQYFSNKKISIKCKIDLKLKVDNIDESFDEIEKSRIIIFCLTIDYLKSIEFKNELKFAKENEKQVLFLLMEEKVDFGDDYSSFNSIEFYKNDSMAFKGECFYRLCYFIYSLLGYKTSLASLLSLNDEVILKPVNTKYESQKYSLYKNNGKIFQQKKLIKTFSFEFKSLRDVAYIKSQNRYCFLTFKRCYFYDTNFSYINKFTHPREGSYSFSYQAVLIEGEARNMYLACNINDKLYIEMYDEMMQLKKEVKLESCSDIKIYQKKIFIITFHKLIVYNLNLDIIHEYTFPNYNKGSSRILIKPKCNNYVYFVNKDSKSTTASAFNINGFQFNQNLVLENQDSFLESESFVANNLLFINKILDKNILVYEIEYKRHEDVIDKNLAGYICQLNEYPPHLLKHPYVLPCGSLACLECIYENYNLYLNKFICVACGNNEHQQLKNQLMKSTVIKDNLKIISETQVGHLRQGVKDILIDKYECLKNCFNFLEEDIEIRVESLLMQIDENELTQLKCIDRLEKKLLNKIFKKKNNKRQRTSAELNDNNTLDLYKYTINNCLYRQFSIEADQKLVIGSIKIDIY